MLIFVEGLLRALVDTSEALIDVGRWSLDVATTDGLVEYTLALPDLLDPPDFSLPRWTPSLRRMPARQLEPDRCRPMSAMKGGSVRESRGSPTGHSCSRP